MSETYLSRLGSDVPASIAFLSVVVGFVWRLFLGKELIGLVLIAVGCVIFGGMLISAIASDQDTRSYRERGLDPNRADRRPYHDLSDEELKSEYVKAVQRVREVESGGMHLSPTIDRGSLLRQEWRERGNEIDALSQALEEAGYTLPKPVSEEEPEPTTRPSETLDTSDNE